MTIIGQVQRTPITLGDFITDQFDQEENRSLDELFRDRTRLLNQLSQTRSNRNRKTYSRQLRNIDRLIAVRNSPASSSQPLVHQEQNPDDSGTAASSSSSAAPAPVVPEQPAAADIPADGSWWGLIGAISAVACATLGVAAFSNKETAAQVAPQISEAVQLISEVAQQLLPTKESSLAVVKAIRDQIKADKIVQSWSPSVRRAFNRAIDELIRQVENGKLIKGIDYSIGNGRGFWGTIGNFVLTPIFFKK